MRRGHRPDVMPELWEAHHAGVYTSRQVVRLAPGNPARSVKCPGCGLAAGGAPVHIVGVILSLPCDGCGDHLLSCGFNLHARCAPLSERILISEALERLGLDGVAAVSE
jgi:hypothetical protein